MGVSPWPPAVAFWLKSGIAGRDSEDYKVPFKFTGKLEKVTINITEEELTEELLEQYRQGRVRSAIAQ